MSTRDAFAPAPAQLSGQSEPATEPKKRARKSKKESALSATPGHDLVEEQKEKIFTNLANLNEAEDRLRTAKGFQRGQRAAAIEAVAEQQGYAETRLNIQMEVLGDMVTQLEANRKNYSPIDVLGDLGFLPTTEEETEILEKINNFLSLDFSSVSH